MFCVKLLGVVDTVLVQNIWLHQTRDDSFTKVETIT